MTFLEVGPRRPRVLASLADGKGHRGLGDSAAFT